jgi:ATP-binding protein involved in chromosome partitioning
MIENITVFEQTVKIIVNSELTGDVKNITGHWQSLIEKDSKIKACSVIFTKHTAPALKKDIASKNDSFLNKYDLSHLGKIIFIASGKGGVGKSTISNNIATSIAEMGFNVGLMDADIYGPRKA